jgi:AraC-like DNA-binding protein
MSAPTQFYREIINRKITLRLLEYYETGYVHMYEYTHWHSNIEICRVAEGECDFIIRGKSYHAQCGDIMVIGSGEIHTYNKIYGDCKIDICTFSPSMLYGVHTSSESVCTHISKKQLSLYALEEKIAECFSDMYDEYHKKDNGAKILLKASLLRLYGLLIRHFAISEKKQNTRANKALLQKILEYIQEHYTERISLKTVAEEFSYSPVYISSLFKSCTGLNFKYYLDNIRIIEAVELLATSDMTVTEISRACGFENIRTFNNVFRKITNETPTVIKRTS